MAVVVATALPLLQCGGGAVRWIYAAGALAVIAGRALTPFYDLFILLVRRLYRMEVWAGIMFAAGAFFLFWPGASAQDAIAFTLAGGALEVYASLTIPRAARRKG